MPDRGAPIYAGDPDPQPDAAFVPGELRHLIAGNRGRLLDARRTPITVTAVSPPRGSFTVRIDAFEDAGASWELGLDEVERFQFDHAAVPAGDAQLAELEQSRARFDRDLSIDCDAEARSVSLVRLEQRRHAAGEWLDGRRTWRRIDVGGQISRREGHPALFALLEQFLSRHELADLEREFTASLITNPRAGETVKGHAIVAAELGLCPYHGKAPRDRSLFAGGWSRARRADHLLWRLAFTRELWHRLGCSELLLYRAVATEGPLTVPRSAGFVSATFSRQVAEAHFAGGPSTRNAALWRQHVPLERVLMTFLETVAMNRQFKEAEAILLADPSTSGF